MALTDVLSAIDTNAAALAPADEPEAVDALRRQLRDLVAGDPAARLDAWGDLYARFLEGHVTFPVAVPLLVDLAESLDEPVRCAALALLVGLGRDANDDETAQAEIDAAFASVATRLDRLSGLFGLSPRLAKRAARRARGTRYGFDAIRRDAEKVENRLSEEAVEQARRAQAASLTPEALSAAARAAVVHDDRTASDAITLAWRCLNVGRPEEVFLICEKLGERRARAEPVRIRALIRLGRIAEGREAAIALANAWLMPATSIRSVNQVLEKSEMQELLRDVRSASGGKDLDELANAIDRAEIEVFIETGDYI
jgi:hypothetical protein